MYPEYIKLAQTAYDTVLATMLEGEATHQGNEWQMISAWEHMNHAMQHMAASANRDTSEDHIGHAITRLAMIKVIQK